MTFSPNDRNPAAAGGSVPVPAGLKRTLVFIAVALACSFCLTGWLDVAGTQALTGHLRAESTFVAANHAARIHKLLAETDETLPADQPLVQLTHDQLEADLAQATRDVETLTADLERLRAKAKVELDWRIKELEAEEFKTRLHAATLLKEQYAYRLEEVAWQDFVKDFDAALRDESPEDFFKSLIYQSRMTGDEARIRAILRQEAAQNSAEVNAAQIELCDQRLHELADVKAELPQTIRRAVGMDVAETLLAQAKHILKQLEQRKPTLTLDTPAYGTVGVFRKKVGDRVNAGEPIVELLDQDRRYVIVLVPTRLVTHFEAGADVRLLFPGGKHRQGRVQSVPPQTLSDSHEDGTSGAEEAVVKVRVDPAGKLWPHVPIGSVVEVLFDDRRP